MTEAARKLLEDVLALPEDERLELASQIIASVDGPADADWQAAWLASPRPSRRISPSGMAMVSQPLSIPRSARSSLRLRGCSRCIAPGTGRRRSPNCRKGTGLSRVRPCSRDSGTTRMRAPTRGRCAGREARMSRRAPGPPSGGRTGTRWLCRLSGYLCLPRGIWLRGLFYRLVLPQWA